MIWLIVFWLCVGVVHAVLLHRLLTCLQHYERHR